MYLRTQCRNEGLRLKYTKIQNQHIYITKKRLKCTRYVIRTQLVQLASWRKWDPRCSYPRDQIKLYWPRNGVGGSLGAVGLQLFPNHPLCLQPQPIAWGNFQHPIPRVGDKEKHCCTPERFPPTECSRLWAGFINLVSC